MSEPPPDKVAMDRADEVGYAQERLRQEPVRPRTTTAAPHGSPPAARDTRGPAAAAAAPTDPRAIARVAAALAGLALAIALGYPAFHDALSSRHLVVMDRAGRVPAADGASGGAGPSARRDVAVYLMIDAKPAGATVTVDGVAHGASPVMTNTTCVPGHTIRVEVSARGFETYGHELPCQAGPVIELAPSLIRQR